MISWKKKYVQAFNAQIVVAEEPIIIGAGITQDANDMNQMFPMLEATKAAMLHAGIDEAPQEVLADTGYWNEASISLDRPEIQERFIVPFRKDWGARERTGQNRNRKLLPLLKRK